MGALAIIVHGGAWEMPDALEGPVRQGCREAAAAGYAVLARGGTAVEAVSSSSSLCTVRHVVPHAVPHTIYTPCH
jgi:isoaspartyl peptidase/L-asparaginase-like protein (Ntn-hydrolase superfamily)